MKLIATKPSTAGEMMLTEINPWNAKYQPRMYKMFEETRQDMLTDDPLQEGQEVEREEYEEAYQCLINGSWISTNSDKVDYYNSIGIDTRQILRRKAVAETENLTKSDMKKDRPEVGDHVSGSWRDPATGFTYFAEGTLREFPGGLFVQDKNGPITGLDLFFHFTKIKKAEAVAEKQAGEADRYPMEFIEWYSNMDKEVILRFYAEWLKDLPSVPKAK